MRVEAMLLPPQHYRLRLWGGRNEQRRILTTGQDQFSFHGVFRVLLPVDVAAGSRECRRNPIREGYLAAHDRNCLKGERRSPRRYEVGCETPVPQADVDGAQCAGEVDRVCAPLVSL